MLIFTVITVVYIFSYTLSSYIIAPVLINRFNKDIYRDKILHQKLRGSLWRLFIYLFLSLYGVSTLHNEKWVLHPYAYISGIPRRMISNSIRIYYYMEVLHYIFSLYLLFAEPRMEDFFQMMAHHFITLFLIIGSYYKSQSKFGTVVMFLHDVSDPIMEIAKICFYLKRQDEADLLFSIFAILFIFSRCILYPLLVILPGLITAVENAFFSLINFIVLFLCLLLVINLIWGYLILKMAFAFYKKGSVKDGDIRENVKVATKIK